MGPILGEDEPPRAIVEDGCGRARAAASGPGCRGPARVWAAPEDRMSGEALPWSVPLPGRASPRSRPDSLSAWAGAALLRRWLLGRLCRRWPRAEDCMAATPARRALLPARTLRARKRRRDHGPPPPVAVMGVSHCSYQYLAKVIMIMTDAFPHRMVARLPPRAPSDRRPSATIRQPHHAGPEFRRIHHSRQSVPGRPRLAHASAASIAPNRRPAAHRTRTRPARAHPCDNAANLRSLSCACSRRPSC